MFIKTFFASWADIDFNHHMRNTAYLNKSGDVRMMFFAENGFPVKEFLRMRLGPVILKDEITYIKEIGLLEEFRVSLVMAGLSEDGSRFYIRNEFRRSDGKLAAKVTSIGGWLDLAHRTLVAPPAALLSALQSLPKTDDFKTLDSSVR